MSPAVGLLAAFVSPALFSAGAAAVALPVLIHLLARRRFKRIRWAAMDFLVDAERRNRRRIRMEDWILLALRCLAVLFIALIVSRPFISPAGLATRWAGSQSIERVFILDDSFSMGYESQGETSFDRAKLAVQRLLESLRRETPDDTVTILRMSAMDKPVESGTYLEDAQVEALLARLEALEPSQRSIDARRVIEAVADMLEDNSGIVNAAVYFITDLQRVDWVDSKTGDESNGPAGGILDRLAAWSDTGDRGLRVVFINVGDSHAANTAVTDLTFRAGRLVAGTTTKIRATLANFGAHSLENVELRMTIANLVQPPKMIRELTAGQSVALDLEGEFLRAGHESVRVELPDDALPVDNARYLPAEVANAVRILIINGEPSVDDYDDEVTFLTTALRPEGEVFSGNELVIADEAELEEANLSEFHAVVLANVYRVSEPAVELLEGFVRHGGGLVIFVGDQVDPSLYNAALYRQGEGLLPAELTERIRPSNASHLVVSDRLHPVMQGLSREGDPLGIGQIPFFEYFACVPAEQPHTTPTPGDNAAANDLTDPSTPTAQPARVIARMDDPDEHPAIVERAFGKGRVVLVTTSADKEWHHWPDHPTFLPVMMELIQHVARRGDAGRGHRVGTPIDLFVDPAVFEPGVVVRTPAYPAEREVAVTALPAPDGRGLVLTWDHTDDRGLYQFLLQRREGGEELRLVAVNVDSRESDLSMAEHGELRKAAGDVPFEYIEGVDRLAGGGGEARTELWRVFLFAALAVLMGEQCLAWWWGRRR